MNKEYPIDEICQAKNQLNNIGVIYRVTGNLFIAKQVCKTVPKSYVGSRAAVHEFSVGSAIRMRSYLRSCRADYRYMVTLTYPCGYDSDGRVSKEHLRRFLQEVKREFNRNSKIISASTESKPQRLSLFWFLEFQERGAPHYHILSTHRIDKTFVSRRWYDIVNSEDVRHLQAGTKCEKLRCGRAGTIKYAIKYANKLTQKVVPKGYENVGRFWGITGDRWCVSADTFLSRPDMLSGDHIRVQNNLKRLVKTQIMSGIMQIFKRDTGILIGIVKDERQLMLLRFRIGALASSTGRIFDYYSSADIDEPEFQYADKML